MVLIGTVIMGIEKPKIVWCKDIKEKKEAVKENK